MPALYFLSLQRDLILSTNAAYTGRSSPVSKAPKHGACVGDWTGAPPTGLQSQHVFCFSPRVRTPPSVCNTWPCWAGIGCTGSPGEGTGDIQPVQNLSPAMEYLLDLSLISSNQVPSPGGLTSSALLEGIHPPSLGRFHRAKSSTSRPVHPPNLRGGPLTWGMGPPIPPAAFQKGDSTARDRSHTVQNISPLVRRWHRNSKPPIPILQRGLFSFPDPSPNAHHPARAGRKD